MDIGLIHQRLAQIVSRFRAQLYHGAEGFVDELLRMNETHVAVETLCEHLMDMNIVLDSQSYKDLARIAQKLEIRPIYWEKLLREDP